MKRRHFVKYSLATGTITAAAIGLMPSMLFARLVARETFEASTVQEVVKELFGNQAASPSNAIELNVPVQSDGKSVPVNIATRLDNIEMIAITTENKHQPLASVVNVTGPVGGYSTRIRIDKTSMITVYIKANGKLYNTSAKIKISKGGYGMSH